MKRILLSLFLLAVAGVRDVLAHKSSDAYLAIAISNHVAEVRLDVALRDLQEAIGLDANEDGVIVWSELESRKAALDAYVSSRLGLAVQGRRLEMAPWRLAAVNHSDGCYAVLFSQAPMPPSSSSLEVGYHLLFDVDAQHRGLTSIRRSGNDAFGGAASFIFSPDSTSHSFPLDAETQRMAVADFIREGVHHIWTGYDHILFLLALLLPAVVRQTGEGKWLPVDTIRSALREVVSVVTSFTIAHSLTLGLAATGLLRLPSRWVESAIAASVVIAAFGNLVPRPVGELAHESRFTTYVRKPWLIAFSFGLIHGFGFASVLGDLGMDRLSFGAGLFGFNFGVELGQLAIVAVFIPIAFLIRETWLYRRLALQGGSLAIMAVAGAWFAERASGTTFMPF